MEETTKNYFLDRRQAIEHLRWLDSLVEDPELQALEREKCRRDPVHWMRRWVWTLDTHDKIEPVKRFPMKDYILELIEIFRREQLILIAKSRQMMVSWLMMALLLHETQFNDGRSWFVQSKKLQDADDLLNRAEFMLRYQPKFLRPVSARRHMPSELSFPSLNSMLRGLPEGGDQIRMHTATGIFMDEGAFQPRMEEAFTAAKPTIDGGGKFVAVSTANPSFFEQLVNDR